MKLGLIPINIGIDDPARIVSLGGAGDSHIHREEEAHAGGGRLVVLDAGMTELIRFLAARRTVGSGSLAHTTRAEVTVPSVPTVNSTSTSTRATRSAPARGW